MTVQQAEEIPFERVQKARQTTEEKRAEKEDLKSALQGSDKSAVVGRSASASWSAPVAWSCISDVSVPACGIQCRFMHVRGYMVLV